MNYTAPFETERLRLRPFSTEDMPAAMAFFVTERARWHGAGPELGEGRAWRICATLLGHWHIHGFGSYALVEKATGRTLGGAGIFHPAGYHEPEMAWTIYDDQAEGKGFASEGARAIIDRYLGEFGWPTLVSYIEPANARSIALAERLGATLDRDAPGVDPDDLVYRHRRLA